MRSYYKCIDILLPALVIISLQTTQAQTAPVNITTTAAPFLRIAPDARAGGMGNLGLATAPDAGSMYYNFAKTPFASSRTSIGVNYTPWMRAVSSDIYLLSATGYHQLDEQQAVGASVRYFNMGDLPVSDYRGQKLTTSQPREIAIDLGYARKLSHKLSLGATLRYINSRLVMGNMDGITYKAGNTLAGDVSLYYSGVDSAKGGWSVGLALTNMGGKVGYTDQADAKEFLPADLGVGIAYTKVVDEDNRIMIGADYHQLLVPEAPVDANGLKDYYNKSVTEGWFDAFGNKSWSLAAGAEYIWHSHLSVRAGYIIVPDHAGGNGGFTAGAGLSFHGCTAHFAYLAPSNKGVGVSPLSNTLKFGLLFTL